MARIEKLTIRGIRGFGPDETDTQRITFTPPLTLILGPNGAGKSTIIECLRLMATGDMPPGQGQCFVHDPLLSGRATTHAKIEMRFIDGGNQGFDVSKIFTLTKKDKTFKFATNDTCITNLESRKNLGPKCLDINNFMGQALGVPKAVLQNVIFCHHTDSEWPLGEGKLLKERFDAIFSATKYVDILEVINKEKKEAMANISTGEALRKPVTEKLQNFREDVKAIKTKKSIIEKKQIDLDDLRHKVAKVQEERNEIEKKFVQISSIEQEYHRYSEERNLCEKRLKELRSGVSEIMGHSRESLEEELQNFDERMAERKKEVERSRHDIKETKEATEKKRNDLREKEASLVRLESERRQHEHAVARMLGALQALSLDLGIAATVDAKDHVAERTADHVKKIDNALKLMDRNLVAKKEKYSNELLTLQKKIQKQSELKASFKARLDTLCDKRDNILSEIASRKEELNLVSSIEDKMANFNASIKHMEEAISRLKGQANVGSITSLEEKLEELSRKEADLNQELNSATRNSAARNKIQGIEDQIVKKAKVVSNIKSRLTRDLKDPLASMEQALPSLEWARVVKSTHSVADSQITDLQTKLESEVKLMTKVQTELSVAQEERTKYQRRLKDLREKIDDEIGLETTLAEALSETEDRLSEVRNRDSIFIGTQHVYGRYQKKLADQRKSRLQQCCPLCDRALADPEVQNLERKLEKLVTELPKIRQGSDTELDQLSKRISSLNLLKRDDNERAQIEDDLLPGTEQKVQKLSDSLKELEKVTHRLRKELDAKIVVAAALVKQVGPCDLLDSGQRELDTMRAELKKEMAALEDEGRDVADVMADINDVKNDKSNLERERKLMQEKLKEMGDLQVKLGEVRNSRLELENKASKEGQMREQLEKLEAELAQTNHDVPEMQDKYEEADNSLKDFESTRADLSREHEKQIDEATSKNARIKQERHELGRTLRNLEDFERSGTTVKIDSLKKEVTTLKDNIQELRSSCEDKESNCRKLEIEISSEASRRRELTDNIAIIDKEAELKELQVALTKCKKLLNEQGVHEAENIREQYTEIKTRHEELKADELSTASDLRNLQKSLEEEERRLERVGSNAEEEYKNWVTDLVSAKRIAKDLDISYAFLNRAILAFHQEKMSLINRIIRDYWVRVYKGIDIDSIQIKFNEDTGTSKASSKRSYQYRVVMIRQGVEQDMRSRCSAGQRVLASLIVRLALAEAFCEGCAMLALDEPTTNLDHENIMSLAAILAEIVRSRRAEKNFQMVVITHDESFILALSKHLEDVGEVKHYYRVEKNDLNYSVVSKRKLYDDDFDE